MNASLYAANRLPAHALSFGAPVDDAASGIPFGNGSMGGTIWFSPDAIRMQINHTDLWEESSLDRGCFCSNTEEDLTCHRHGGEVILRFHSPILDPLYPTRYHASLTLHDATIRMKSECGFGCLSMSMMACRHPHVIALSLEGDFADEDPMQILLTRYGSRNLWRWYGQGKEDGMAGLDGTEAMAEDGRLYIEQTLRGCAFCLGLSIVPEKESAPDAGSLGRHTATYTLESRKSHKFTLYITLIPAETAASARVACKDALMDAEGRGWDALYADHAGDWAEFWSRSYLRLGDSYLENCYYLSLYYSACECLGKYPPLFTNGIFGFRHDFSPWAYYFHYNMQHMYGPLLPSGHGELCENYYAMRARGLDMAKRYAEEVKGTGGGAAFYHDVTDPMGRGADYDSHNCTPTSQIAMAMWRYYRYTGDEAFKSTAALPVMEAATAFYLSMLKKEEDGLYHIHGTTAYEGTPLYHDTITDLSMIRGLFGVMATLYPERKELTDVLAHLPETQTLPMEADECVDGNFVFGWGKGRAANGNRVFSIGKDGEGNPVRKNYGNPARDTYGFPDTEMSPIYPAGIFGLKDRGSEAFSIMEDQILLHHHPEEEAGCMQWCMMPIYIARMGMKADLYPYLRAMLSGWQIYPCGLGVDGPGCIAEAKQRGKFYSVYDRETNRYAALEAWGFRHFDMETLPIVAHALCEGMLQSYEGILRVFPACDDAESAFTLYSEGGFRITAQRSPLRIRIDSLRGEKCRLILPDDADPDSFRAWRMGEGTPIPVIDVGRERALDLTDLLKACGGSVLLAAEDPGKEPFGEEGPCPENRSVKHCGRAILGIPSLEFR